MKHKNLPFYHSKCYYSSLKKEQLCANVNRWMTKDANEPFLQVIPPWGHHNPAYLGEWLTDDTFLIRRNTPNTGGDINPFRPKIEGHLFPSDKQGTNVYLRFYLSNGAIGWLSFLVLFVFIFLILNEDLVWYHLPCGLLMIYGITQIMFTVEYWIARNYIKKNLKLKHNEKSEQITK